MEYIEEDGRVMLLFYGLIYDAVSISNYIASKGRMISG
jgi:hypothetical protein